ncbi:MAG: hypothetical protein RR386_06195, partial [Bacteroidaceae bacterium]
MWCILVVFVFFSQMELLESVLFLYKYLIEGFSLNGFARRSIPVHDNGSKDSDFVSLCMRYLKEKRIFS